MTLTPRQRAVLAFIRTYRATHDWPPTVREIADGCGFSPSAAHYQLTVLERLGYLRRGHGARAIALTNQEI